jgi:UDP-N-acetylglucosamine acyltransferase
MHPLIHPTAVIEKGAQIGEGVSIGAFCVIGADVVLEEGVTLASHVVVEGRTKIGARTKIYPFAVIGHAPQDLKYQGEPSTLSIGQDCTIREHVTIHPGTKGDKMHTKVGNHCLLMVGSHVAHDCVLGDHVILANNATLAGHVVLGDYVLIGGLSAVHQFVRIGHHAVIGGMSGIENDVIPYGAAMGERAHLSGLNLVGLKRRGFSREAIHGLRRAYEQLFTEQEGTFAQRLETLAKEEPAEEVRQLVDFLSDSSSRAITRPKAA